MVVAGMAVGLTCINEEDTVQAAKLTAKTTIKPTQIGATLGFIHCSLLLNGVRDWRLEIEWPNLQSSPGMPG
jgi:hypothetical protein